VLSCWKAAVVSLVAASTASAQADRAAEALHRFELDNGLELIVVENHAAPLATVLLAIRGGAAVQVKGEEGLAHLFEHVVFRSYGNEPAAFHIDAAKLNAISNGATDHELVYYFLTLPSENTEKGIRLLGRLITRAEFRRRDLKDEVNIVLDELERGQSDPEQALMRQVSRHLWGEAWHRRDLGGDSVSLMAITEDRLTEDYARFYVPNNAALIVTGDVSPSSVFEDTERHFGEWKRGPDPFDGAQFAPILPLSRSRAALVSHDPLYDVTIRLAMQGPSLRDDRAATYAADVLLQILNEPSSVFQERLVGSGLFQALGSSYLTLSEVGPITIAGKTTAFAAHDALLALIAQIDSLNLLVGVTDEDLAIAKKRREVDAVLALESTGTLAPSVASWWAGAGMDYYLSYRERLNAQTLEDLRQFARRYLVNQPRVIGMLGPTATMARIEDWLRGSSGKP
jgi:zinc protease